MDIYGIINYGRTWAQKGVYKMLGTKKYNVCSITGTRKCKLSQTDILPTLKNIINMGYNCFGVGGAVGFDTIAALAILDLRKSYPIKLISVLPYRHWYDKFNSYDKKIAIEIMQKSDKIVILADNYSPWVYSVRNRHLVQYADMLLAHCPTKSGGTMDTVHKAIEKGIPIMWI